MFKRLARRMMLSNVAILVIFMLVIFTSLYMSVYQEVTNRNNEELKALEQINILSPQPGQPVLTNFARNFNIVVVVDDTGTELVVKDIISEFNVSDDFVEALVSDTDIDGDRIEIDDLIFDYSVREVNSSTVIAYIDVTKDVELLQASLIRYLIIFVITSGFATLISHFLTKRNILPIEVSYGKQKEFVQNASHELKTPLTVINTNIDVLLSTKEYKDNKWLKYVKTEVKRMNKLTHDLLYLANNEEQNVIKTEFNASESLEGLLLGVEALAYENKIELDYTVEENLQISFNKEQYIQVVLILLDNAIKYTEPGHKISVSLQKDSKFTVLKVRNTGEGIKEDDLVRLFERFYKVDKSRENKQNSYGLGLSIAKAIMDNHKGSISVSSVYKEYTEFELRFK